MACFSEYGYIEESGVVNISDEMLKKSGGKELFKILIFGL